MSRRHVLRLQDCCSLRGTRIPSLRRVEDVAKTYLQD